MNYSEIFKRNLVLNWFLKSDVAYEALGIIRSIGQEHVIMMIETPRALCGDFCAHLEFVSSKWAGPFAAAFSECSIICHQRAANRSSHLVGLELMIILYPRSGPYGHLDKFLGRPISISVVDPIPGFGKVFCRF